jgi:hypothetical protein
MTASTAACRPGSVFLLGTARTATAGCAVLAAGLAAQLWRHDALLGGQVARHAIRHDARGWEWPHFVANGVSVVGGTVVAPALLLTMAAVLSVRAERWRPLVGAAAAVLLADVCLAAGKLILGQSAVSGPATVTVVCWGVGAWLLRGRMGTRVRRAMHALAASAALAIGVAQLYLGHPWTALLLSWALGAAVLGVLTLVRRRTRRETGAPAADAH